MDENGDVILDQSIPRMVQDNYLSCEWIEGGIAFNRRSLHACLIVHHRTGLPFFADYNGGPLPLDHILRIRNDIREKNRSGEPHAECRGCAHLKKKQWPAPTHSINLVGIAHYSHCNIKCNYCYLQTQDPASFESGFRPYRLLNTVRQLLDEGTLAPDSIIDWGGGEPTAYREFDDILALTLERGAFHYVHSNGVRLPELIGKTSHADRIHVICSVDAGLPQTYLRMKKRNYLERVWTNLAAYIAAGCRVTIKYIVREDNCSDADINAFCARAVAIGARDLILDIDFDFPIPKTDIVLAIARLRHRASRAGLHVRYGFTGDNFAAENNVADRVHAAFEHEQLQEIRRILLSEDYAVPDCVDGAVEDLVTTLHAHCDAKDVAIRDLHAELARLHAHCDAKDAAIRDLHAELAQLYAHCNAKDAAIHSMNDQLERRHRLARFLGRYRLKVLTLLRERRQRWNTGD